jgi:hypothetical protein
MPVSINGHRLLPDGDRGHECSMANIAIGAVGGRIYSWLYNERMDGEVDART